MRAGLIAHRLGHEELFSMLEESLLAQFCHFDGKISGGLEIELIGGWHAHVANAHFQQLLDWAETTKSQNIASLCGAYLAAAPDQPAFSFAVRHAIKALAKLKDKNMSIFS